eukprot:jgi/Botrbrau1/9718/Bobra.0388s0011.1
MRSPPILTGLSFLMVSRLRGFPHSTNSTPPWISCVSDQSWNVHVIYIMWHWGKAVWSVMSLHLKTDYIGRSGAMQKP